jgi:hypothetical protein
VGKFVAAWLGWTGADHHKQTSRLRPGYRELRESREKIKIASKNAPNGYCTLLVLQADVQHRSALNRQDEDDTRAAVDTFRRRAGNERSVLHEHQHDVMDRNMLLCNITLKLPTDT